MSKERHKWVFRGALVTSLAMLVYMFLPFLAILLTVLVLTVVSWPIHERLSGRIGRVPSALLMTLGLTSIVLGPLTFATWLGLREAWDAAEDLLVWVNRGGLDELSRDLERWLSIAPPIAAYLHEGHLTDWISTTIEQAVGKTIQEAAGRVTGALGFLIEGMTHLMVGLASWLALYIEGPHILSAVRRIELLSDSYTDRLLLRFRQFAQSVIVGMAVTASSQGVVAAIGFWLVGVERVALLGFMTAVLSQFPIIGSSVIWVPLAASLATNGHYASALFIVVWSIALTASVDNLLKPIVYHESLNVHPVFVLLSLLAGVTSFGPAGVITGPLLLVLFLTLWTLYDRDVLGSNGPTSSDPPSAI